MRKTEGEASKMSQEHWKNQGRTLPRQLVHLKGTGAICDTISSPVTQLKDRIFYPLFLNGRVCLKNDKTKSLTDCCLVGDQKFNS